MRSYILDNLFHLLGGYKNVFRFRLAFAIVVSVLGVVCFSLFLQSTEFLERTEPRSLERLLALVSILAVFPSLVTGSYFLVLKAVRCPLSEVTLNKLAPAVVQHYKNEAITYKLHRPITWVELYSYMKFLEKQQKSEAKKAFEQKVLAQQKTWLKDLV